MLGRQSRHNASLVMPIDCERRIMMELGDIVISKHGSMYSYAYNPYLERFMYRRHGTNLEAIWFELSEISVKKIDGNIYECLTMTLT